MAMHYLPEAKFVANKDLQHSQALSEMSPFAHRKILHGFQ